MNAGGREIDGWRDLIDRRLAVELGAVQLAAERGTDEAFDHLAEHNAVMRESVEDWRTFRRADVHFHLGLAETAGSAWLVQEMTEVHGEFSELLDIAPHPSLVMEHSAQQHDRILEALRSRDADESIRRMREHIRGSEALFEGLRPGGD
jgi:GntR family transcriptional repressor for pyruvate dehydrogenase complex